MSAILEFAQELAANGGFVMLPLLLVAFLLGFIIIYRLYTLATAFGWRFLTPLYHDPPFNHSDVGINPMPPQYHFLNLAKSRLENYLGSHTRHITKTSVSAILSDLFLELNKGRMLLLSLTVIAPLLGLLGTVSGMINVFNTLGSAGQATNATAVSWGIAQALFTTEVGLIIAVPGLIMGKLLEKKQHHAESLLDNLLVVFLKQGGVREENEIEI